MTVGHADLPREALVFRAYHWCAGKPAWQLSVVLQRIITVIIVAKMYEISGTRDVGSHEKPTLIFWSWRSRAIDTFVWMLSERLYFLQVSNLCTSCCQLFVCTCIPCRRQVSISLQALLVDCMYWVNCCLQYTVVYKTSRSSVYPVISLNHLYKPKFS